LLRGFDFERTAEFDTRSSGWRAASSSTGFVISCVSIFEDLRMQDISGP